MTNLKDTAPLERAPRPGGGFFNKKGIALLSLGALGVGALAAYGFTIRGGDESKIEVSDVEPARLNVNEARPPAYTPPPAESAPADRVGDTPEQPRSFQGTGGAEPKRKGPPEGWQRASVVVMRRGAVQGGQTEQAGMQGAQYPGGQGSSIQGGYAGSQQGGGRNGKADFYAGGSGAFNNDLDVAGELMPEAEGCVVKAGTQITLQTRSAVRTTLPQKVLGYVVNPVEGNHYIGNGRVDRCLAIPAGSTILSEINASGVERGDMRIQACALRLDIRGGGRRPLGCQPAHGADGGAGIEAESDYAVSGILTGILIEAALSTVRGLGGLISGPPGVAVQVGTGMISDVGSEYVKRELMRPPVLTMNAGAIYGVQLNGDLALPLD